MEIFLFYFFSVVPATWKHIVSVKAYEKLVAFHGFITYNPFPTTVSAGGGQTRKTVFEGNREPSLAQLKAVERWREPYSDWAKPWPRVPKDAFLSPPANLTVA